MNLTLRNAFIVSFIVLTAILASNVIASLYNDFSGDNTTATFIAAIIMQVIIVLGLFNLSKLESFVLFESSEKKLKTLFKSGFCYFVAVLVFGILIVGQISNFVLENLFGISLELQPSVDLLLNAKTSHTYILAALAVGIFAPIAEELLFRAVIFRGLKSKFTTIGAMIISSIIFALVHYSLSNFAALFTIGIIFCIAYEKSKDIRVPMIAHSLFNFFNFLFIFYFGRAEI